LIVAAAGGDQDAWDELVDRHAQHLWDWLRSFGLDAATAAAISQLSWRRLADHLDDLGTDEELCDWLCGAAEREVRAIPRLERFMCGKRRWEIHEYGTVFSN
jgi:DNA-directed RNA polymerase specialized sigma24 family protein